MEELKACPFCGGEAKAVYGAVDYNVWQVMCKNDKCDCMAGWGNTKEEAITAWNRRPAPENNPLTVEELRGMVGEPVWIETGEVTIKEQIIGAWRILHSVNDLTAVFMGGGNGLRRSDYGKTWLAYARKPEQEATP